MVCRLTLRRASFAAHHKTIEQSLARFAALRARLLENVDRDAQSYQAVLAALKLPKSTDTERAERGRAVGTASKMAAEIPLETAELTAETARAVEALGRITIPQAASDLAVALYLAQAARRGAAENVRANLPSVQDPGWVNQVEAKLQAL
jgi:formiminotetrahydrofolate cyclodeaminase